MFRSWLRWAPFLVVLTVGPLPADAPPTDSVHQAALALYDGIQFVTLDNGLRVYLKPVPDAPVVTTMMAYRVGSADENLDHTGLSHYLEHLMFKGTDKIMPGDIDRLTLRNGGANNAYTSEDMTVYHFDFAADRWEQALEVEADRMRHLRIDAKHEFEQEKGAVIEELQRNEDEPWDLENKAIVPLLFGKGPYGHPVIGERQHVRGATAEVIKAHYDKWYHPNNASLVICGGFDPQRALARVKELFGAIPKAELPARKQSPELLRRKEPTQAQIESKFEVPRMVMGFNTVRSSDSDAYALDVIQAILSSGKTSRFYRQLIEGAEIASSSDASSVTGRYPGWFSISVQLLPGQKRQRAEELVLAELKRLQDEPVGAEELARVRRGVLTGAIFGRESVHQLADSIARGVTTNDLDYLKGYLGKIAAVTAADVQAVARKYFDPSQRVVVWSVPPDKKEGAAPRDRRRNIDSARTGRAAEKGGAQVSLKDARRVVLPNGLTLLLLEQRRLPIVYAEALLVQSRLVEPAEKAGVATLTGNMIDEGTDKHSGQEIARQIESVGGTLALTSSGGSVKVLTSDRHLGLSMLLECMMRSNFPADALQREKAQLLSAIDEAERRADDKAARVFQALLYGEHPLGRSTLGTRKTVEPLTRDDCAAFFAKVFIPNNVVFAVVGDFETATLIDEIKTLTADWKKTDLPKPKLPAVVMPGEFSEKIVSMPAAAQLHFYMGHPGIRRNNADYYKLLVMDYVLGTGPGFTDRLSSRLRDREGLAYTVSASITSSAGLEPGLFTCYVGTGAENLAKVKRLFLEELNRLRDETPAAEEVDDAKRYLLGNLPFRFTTSEGIAGQLLSAERFGLGLGYLDDYRRQVAAVTPADVQTMARTYLNPSKMVLVAVGAVDASGKPLSR
jgi:zinc protease